MDNKCIRRRIGLQNNSFQTVSETEENRFNNFVGNPSSFEDEREDAQRANIKRLNQEENNTKRLNRDKNNEKIEEQDKQGAWNALLEIAEKQFYEQADKKKALKQKGKALRRHMRNVEDVQAYWDNGTEKASEKIEVLRETMTEKGNFPKAVMKFLKDNPNSFAQLVRSGRSISGKAHILNKAEEVAQVEAYWNDPSVEASEKAAVLRESVKQESPFPKAVTEFLQDNPNCFVKMVSSAQNISDKACTLSKAKVVGQVEAYWNDSSVKAEEKAAVLRATMTGKGCFPSIVTEFLKDNPNRFAQMVRSGRSISGKAYILSKAEEVAQVEAYWNDPSVEVFKKAAVLRKTINEKGCFPRVITEFLKANPNSFVQMVCGVQNISGKAYILGKAEEVGQVEAYWNDPSVEVLEKAAVLRESVKEAGSVPKAVTKFLKDSPDGFAKMVSSARNISGKARILSKANAAGQVEAYWNDSSVEASEKIEVLRATMTEKGSFPRIITKFLEDHPNSLVELFKTEQRIAIKAKMLEIMKTGASLQKYWSDETVNILEKEKVLATLIASNHVSKVVTEFLKTNPNIFVQMMNNEIFLMQKIAILKNVPAKELVAAYWDAPSVEASEKAVVLAKAIIAKGYIPSVLEKFLKANPVAFAQAVHTAEYFEKVEILVHTNKAELVAAYWNDPAEEVSEKANVLTKASMRAKSADNGLRKFLEENLEAFVQVVHTAGDLEKVEILANTNKTAQLKAYWNDLSVGVAEKAAVLVKTIITKGHIPYVIEKFLKDNPEVFVQVVNATNNIDNKVKFLEGATSKQVREYWFYGIGEVLEKAKVLAKTISRAEHVSNGLNEFLKDNLEVFAQVVDAASSAEKVEILASTNKVGWVSAYWYYGTGGALEKAAVLAKAIRRRNDMGNGLSGFFKENPKVFIQVINAVAYAEKVEIVAHMNKKEQVALYWYGGRGGALEKTAVLAKAMLIRDYIPDAIEKFLKDSPAVFAQVVNVINNITMLG